MIKFDLAAAERDVGFCAGSVDAIALHDRRDEHIVVIQQRIGAPLLDAAHRRIPDRLRCLFAEAERKLRKDFLDRAAGFDRDEREAIRIFRISAPQTADKQAAIDLAVEMVDQAEIRLHQCQRLFIRERTAVNILDIEVPKIDIRPAVLDLRCHYTIHPYQLDSLAHGLGRTLGDVLQDLRHDAELGSTLCIRMAFGHTQRLVAVIQAAFCDQIDCAQHAFIQNHVTAACLLALDAAADLRLHTGQTNLNKLIEVGIRARHAEDRRCGQRIVFPDVGVENILQIRGNVGHDLCPGALSIPEGQHIVDILPVFLVTGLVGQQIGDPRKIGVVAEATSLVLRAEADNAHLHAAREQIFVLNLMHDRRKLRAQRGKLNLRRMRKLRLRFPIRLRKGNLKGQVCARMLDFPIVHLEPPEKFLIFCLDCDI